VGTVKLPASLGTDITVTGGAYEILNDGSIVLTEAAQYTISVK
jgi:hypothetical protein